MFVINVLQKAEMVEYNNNKVFNGNGIINAQYVQHQQIMLGKAVLRHSDNRCGMVRVIFRFVELQCKPNAEQARLFCTRFAAKSEIAKG